MLVSVRSGRVKPDSQPPKSVLPRSAAATASTAETAAPAPGDIGSGLRRGAEAAHGAVVLHVAVDLVRNIVIHGDVIDLADGEGDAIVGLAVVRW